MVAACIEGCAAPTPRLPFGALAGGLEPFLVAHPLGAQQPLRSDEVGRTEGASYHLVQIRAAERPHRHVAHDLTVTVLRGRGTLSLGTARLPLAAGDVIIVPRGVVHWFANDGSGPALALVTIVPPLDAPDFEPVDAR